MSLMTFPDFLGYIGSLIVVLLYFLSINGRIDANGLVYPAANLGGCGLIAYSLCYNFNAPSFAIELFWATISVYGIVRHLRARSVNQ